MRGTWQAVAPQGLLPQTPHLQLGLRTRLQTVMAGLGAPQSAARRTLVQMQLQPRKTNPWLDLELLPPWLPLRLPWRPWLFALAV